MTDKEIVELAIAMREAQVKYFRDRTKMNLDMAKMLEHRFDEVTRRPPEKPEQPALF